MFDRHHDALEPRDSKAVDAIHDLVPALDDGDVLAFARDLLSELDDDWLVAGMELGVFSDAVVFGVEDAFTSSPLMQHVDHRRVPHRIWTSSSLPGECLHLGGNLVDVGRSYELQPLWELLEWDPRPGSFGFTVSTDPVMFTIDLDAFAMDWEDFLFAWRDEVWEARFKREGTHLAASGWNGKRLTLELMQLASREVVDFRGGLPGWKSP